jgi:hypothetical protein
MGPILMILPNLVSLGELGGCTYFSVSCVSQVFLLSLCKSWAFLLCFFFAYLAGSLLFYFFAQPGFFQDNICLPLVKCQCWTKLILNNSMGCVHKQNNKQQNYERLISSSTSARQQLSFKNHAWEKPEKTEKQPNRHWRGTEDTPTVCTEAKERHGTHKKQKHKCNHQAIPEILNWVESSKLERILGNLCI